MYKYPHIVHRVLEYLVLCSNLLGLSWIHSPILFIYTPSLEDFQKASRTLPL